MAPDLVAWSLLDQGGSFQEVNQESKAFMPAGPAAAGPTGIPEFLWSLTAVLSVRRTIQTVSCVSSYPSKKEEEGWRGSSSSGSVSAECEF